MPQFSTVSQIWVHTTDDNRVWYSTNPDNGYSDTNRWANVSEWEDIINYWKNDNIHLPEQGEFYEFLEGVFVVNVDGGLSPIPEGLIFWDSEHDDRSILNRAKAGKDLFYSRVSFQHQILKLDNDPTGYEAPRGYHDYNVGVKFFFTSKPSDWGAKRMCVLQGTLLFHITNSNALEHQHYDIKYPEIPVMCVSSGSDDTATLFTGLMVKDIALDLLNQALLHRYLTGNNPYDEFVTEFEDWLGLKNHLLDVKNPF